MREKSNKRGPALLAVLGLLAGLLAWPGIGAAQTVTGEATAVRTTVLGLLGSVTTTFAGTGNLAGTTDARDASASGGTLISGVVGEALHATTIGWPDQVASQASVAGLGLNIPGLAIGADLIIAEAQSALGGASSATSALTNLQVNGVPIAVSGAPNQAVSIPGGTMVINEQTQSASGIVVNALHVVVFGIGELVVGTAAAGIQ